jgi:spermidine/putrescine transport system substrate-binding protein
VWFDGWVIPKTTRNERAAKEFVDFMTRTDIGIRNSIEIVYTSALSKEALIASEGTNYDAIALLIENEYDPEEYFADEIRYPDIFDARFGMMRDFGANNRAVVSMWERVKVTDNSTDLIIITAVCAGVVALFVAGVMLVQSARGKRRKIEE